MGYLLDTCILIDVLKSRQIAIDAVATLPSRPSICPVTTMELLAGAKAQREEMRIEALLGNFLPVALDETVYRNAGRWLRHYQASHGLDIPDALIAATAEHHGLQLATTNVKHFPMFPKLKPAY